MASASRLLRPYASRGSGASAGWNGRPGKLPGVTVGSGFRLGFIAGMVHFAGTVYWTGATMQAFGGLPLPVAMLVTALLVVYLATYVALASAASAMFIRQFGLIGVALAPSAWVATEYARGYLLLGGFPWNPLGNTLITLLPLAQLASLVGVFGLSALVASINAGFAIAALSNGRTRAMAFGGTVMIIAAASIWGGQRMAENRLTQGVPVRVGLIQGNIAPVDKWNPARAGMIVDRYEQLTRQAVANGAEFVLWPESSTPFNFQDDPGTDAIRSMVRELRTPLLLGSDEVERDSTGVRSYNSGFMLDTVGNTAAVHRKIHLVPFGEFLPYRRLLSFLGPLVDGVSAFSPGERVSMLPVREHMVSTAICYEVAFPSLMREAVRQGSELLTTITNDGWFGESSAAYQHFDMAAMRAVEQGRYLVRAANTGISGIVDPYGRVLIRTKLFETTTVVGEARFVHERTLYARIGDLVALVATVITVLALGVALWQKAER
jgi:apolipoprotein N-acyltransferase